MQLKVQLRQHEATIVDLSAQVEALESSRQEAATAAGRATRNVYRIAPSSRKASSPNKTNSQPKANEHNDVVRVAPGENGGAPAPGATGQIRAEIDAETAAAAAAATNEVKKLDRIASKWQSRAADVRRALQELRTSGVGNGGSRRSDFTKDWVAAWEQEDRRPRPRSPNTTEVETTQASKQAAPRSRVRTKPGLLSSSSTGAGEGGLSLPRVPSAAEISYPGSDGNGARSPLLPSLLERLLRDTDAAAATQRTEPSSSPTKRRNSKHPEQTFSGKGGNGLNGTSSSRKEGGDYRGLEATHLSRAATTPARAGGVGGAWDRPGWPTAVSAAGRGLSSAEGGGSGGDARGSVHPSAHTLPVPLQVAQAKALQLLSALPDFPVSLQGRLDLAAVDNSSGGGLALTKGRRKTQKNYGVSQIPKHTGRA